MDEPPGRRKSSRHQVRGRSVAGILVVVLMVAALGACGHGASAAVRVPLLPNAAVNGNAWEWTSTCRVGPHKGTGCEGSGPVVGPAQLTGNEWNLGGTATTAGSVTMSVNAPGALAVKGNLSDAPPCTEATCIAPQANTWVRGYPSVLYGIDQCNADTSPPQSPKLKLPAQVGSLPANLIGTTTYAAEAAKVTYDVAYDLWLNASGTTTPCKTDGTLEVMVWTDYDAQALLPDSLKVGTTTVPYAVNGSASPGEQAWSVYVSNVYGNGHTVSYGGTVWLVLDEAHRVRQGEVSVDLGAALGAVGALLEHSYGWSNFADNYWLDTIAFGMEYGPQSADPYGAGPTDFSLDLRSYCLELGTTVSAATC